MQTRNRPSKSIMHEMQVALGNSSKRPKTLQKYHPSPTSIGWPQACLDLGHTQDASRVAKRLQAHSPGFHYSQVQSK